MIETTLKHTAFPIQTLISELPHIPPTNSYYIKELIGRNDSDIKAIIQDYTIGEPMYKERKSIYQIKIKELKDIYTLECTFNTDSACVIALIYKNNL